MTDLTAERTRKLAAEAQLAEMELAKARHEYVGVADVASAWSEVLSAVSGPAAVDADDAGNHCCK